MSSKIIYQIYPRSFADANGDGVGDLQGIAQKLPYLAGLSPTDVWISPCFASPMKDFGYDISDYRAIDPIFGSNADFDDLVHGMRAASLGVVIDQVWAHTSDKHEWFKASADPAHPNHLRYRDWYTWRDANQDGTVPNNWLSVFGGSAWHWHPRRGQYYLHHFLKEQPALNWHNAAVVGEILEIARFWLKKGVTGFRLDAINFSLCNPTFADNPAREGTPFDGVSPGNPLSRQMFNHVNQPELLRHIAEVRKVLDEYEGTFSVGEIGLSDDSVAYSAEYVGDRLLHTCYNFSLLEARGAGALLSSIQRTLQQYCNQQKQPCWAIGNHDSPRVASRWAHPQTVITPASDVAKRNLLLLFTLPGHVCLYQGDELGLPQAELAFEDLVDPYDREFYPDHVGRDGARTPIPWQKNAAYAGFSVAKPWLKLDPRHYAFAVDQQERDPESVLSFCKALIREKKTNLVLQEGRTAVSTVENDVLVVLRQQGEAFRLVFLNYCADAKDISLRQGGAADFVRGNGVSAAVSSVSLPPEGFAIIDGGYAR